MRTFSALLLIALVGLLCQSCTSQSTEPTSSPDPPRTPSDLSAVEKDLIASSNLFGLNLFKEIVTREDPDSNVFISPLSASFALGMTFNGTALETRDEMREALQYGDLTTDEINQSYKNVLEILTQLDPTVVFEIANGIWYREGKPVKQAYVDLCQQYFNSLVEEVNFQDPAVLNMINDWVSEATHGHIDTIITPPVSGDLALLLANAIYFKGSWTHLFDTSDTKTESFFLRDQSQTDCRMMHRDDTVLFLANNLFQAVDLPYGDEAFSMTVLLPSYGHTTDDIMAQLTADNWASWMDQFSEQEIQLSLPKFRFEYETGLNDMLKAMGMPRAFAPGMAQFYDMFDDSIGWIDTVFQKAFVQVDESGTEAAAVTVVAVYDSMYPGLYANRPFIFMIRERVSETILFMGKIENPVWDEG